MKNILLDLDECLVHVFVENLDWSLYKSLKKSSHKDRVFIVTTPNYKIWGIKRPNLENFLCFCFENFETVSVFSAGTKDYVEACVSVLFENFPKPNAVLSRDQVLYEPNGYCKPLRIFFEYLEGATKANTILLDNQFANSKYDPNNLLHIPDFCPEQCFDDLEKEDEYLVDVMNWIRQNKDGKDDVRHLDKSNVFIKEKSTRFLQKFQSEKEIWYKLRELI